MTFAKGRAGMLVAFVGACLVLAILVTKNSNEKKVAQSSIKLVEKGSDHRLLDATSTVHEQSLPYRSEFGSLPNTLQGTSIIQALAVDEAGHLRLSNDVKMVFDYFLSAVDEESIDVIIGRINEYLDKTLSEPALSEARSVLVAYIDLKSALYDYELEKSEYIKQLVDTGEIEKLSRVYLELLEEQLAERNDLRANYLTEEVHLAFYGEEESYDQYTLSRLKVLSDKEISEEDRLLKLEQIDVLAPASIVDSRNESQIIDELQIRTNALIEQGGNDIEVRALRTQMFGVDAADRFEQLDQERAQWASRVEDYLVQRKAILSNLGLSQVDLESQIDHLHESLFDSKEQIRVKVYERKSDA